MGDRTYCTLRFAEAPSPKILELMDKFIGEPSDIDGNLFGYEDINYGELDGLIYDELIERKVSFIWSWGSGESYGPGLFISKNGETSRFNANEEGTIVLSLDEIADGISLPEALKWEKVQKDIIAGVS